LQCYEGILLITYESHCYFTCNKGVTEVESQSGIINLKPVLLLILISSRIEVKYITHSALILGI